MSDAVILMAYGSPATADDIRPYFEDIRGGRPGHIFNLGHGVLPETDPDVLGRLVQLVHESTPVAA